METLHNGFRLTLPEGAFPLSTDSIALAGFAKLPKKARVLDLGAGCGTLGLLLCARYDDCTVTGVELCAEDHAAALENARQNQLCHRLKSICADAGAVADFLTPGSFDVCISNPPYFTAGPQSKLTPMARHAHTLPLSQLLRSAAWALKFGGDLYLVHKPEMLAQLCFHACQNALEPKALQLLRHTPSSPASLALLHCRKGAKPGLLLQEAVLRREDGAPTDYYKALYHL